MQLVEVNNTKCANTRTITQLFTLSSCIHNHNVRVAHNNSETLQFQHKTTDKSLNITL